MESSEGNDKMFRLAAEDQHGHNIYRALQSFRLAQEMVDLNIIVKGIHFAVHKLLMCAASPYFYQQLVKITLPPKCGTIEQNYVCIVIDRCTPKEFSFILDYIYKGEALVPEKELAGVLQAASELEIVGLCSKVKPNNEINGVPCLTNGTDPTRNPEEKAEDAKEAEAPVVEVAKVEVEQPKINGEEQRIVNGDHHKVNGLPEVTIEPIRARPASGESSNSSGSKTGSSRKKSVPKRLIPHDSSPDSVYAPSNYSREEQNRPTPSSSRGSSHEGSLEGPAQPVDFSSKPAEAINDEEKPLVIHETPEPESKKIRQDILPPLVQKQAPPPSASTASQLLMSMRQNFAWANAGANPFTMMQAALGADQRTSSESSGGVDHDSERDDQRRAQNPRLTHPTLPGMNPQEMIQKLQQAFMNTGHPGAGLINPWATNPLLGQVTSSMPAFSSNSPSLVPAPPSLIGNQEKRSPSNNGTSTSASNIPRGIPAGFGANGKPAVSCEMCGKTLADPSSLYRHRKIHSGEKPHKCPFCGRKFIQRYNMTQHIKTHFKARGINSLANNPATLASFLATNKSALSNYQISDDLISSLANNGGQDVDPEDKDTNNYDEEAGERSPPNNSFKDETQEIDPC